MYKNHLQLQDLKIGDWVQEYSDIIDKPSMPMFVSSIFDDGTVYLGFEGNDGDVWESKIENIITIEISEQTLVGFGFKKGIIGTSLKHPNDGNKIDISFNTERNCWNASIDSHPYAFINCRYIHELQHQVFDITHKPLKLVWKGV
ncbi:hypothetical protein [Prevotella koreensis]